MKKAPLFVGAVTSPPYAAITCDSTKSGMLQYTASGFSGCTGSSWYALSSFLGSSAAATSPARSDDVTTGLFSASASTVSIATAGTERFSITASGNVGIGTTSPMGLLSVAKDIAGTSERLAHFTIQGTSNSNQLLALGYDTTSNYGWMQSVLYGTAAKPLVLQPNGGNVGIGTTSPVAPLHVYSSGTINPDGLGANNLILGHIHYSAGWDALGFCGTYSTAASNPVCMGTNGGTWFWGLEASSTTMTSVMTLTSAGALWTASTMTQNSDRRLKSNIEQITNVFDRLDQINGVTFYWKDKDKDAHQQIGVIAQDVEKAFPQAVSMGPNGFKSVNYSGLVAPLIEAAKELKLSLDALSAKVAARFVSHDQEIIALKATLSDQSTELATLRARLDKLESK